MNQLRRVAYAAVVTALVTVASIAPTPARATTTPDATTTKPTAKDAAGQNATAPGVSLVSQAPWIVTKGAEVMSLHLDEAALASVRAAAVELTIHDSVDTRSTFDQAISGRALGNTLTRLTFPLSSTAQNSHDNFLIGFGLRGSGAPKIASIDSPGVYPVEVGVVGAGDHRGTFVTWLVVVERADQPIPEPLRLSWIWQLTANPLEQAGGVADPNVLRQMQPGGRLDHLARLFANSTNFPLTLAIGPETLTSWIAQAQSNTALAPGADRVRRAVARASTQLLPEPYVPVAGPTIEAEGLGEHVPDEYVAGSNAIEQATGAIPDPRTAFVDPVDDATVARLSQMLVGRYVVRDTALVRVTEPLSPAQPFSLTTAGAAPAPSVATDSAIEQLVQSAGPPALRAQRVVAALAEIAYEAPARARGIVLSTPRDWSPDVATVTILLKSLATDPLVQPATLDDLFATVPAEQRNDAPLERQLAPSPPSKVLPLTAGEYDAATRQLDAYQAMVVRDDPSVTAGRTALVLALATSNTRDQTLALLHTIDANLRAVTDGITTTAKTLTLTARRANLPLSFQNNTKRAGLRVRVHLDSPKLLFPKGPDLVLALPLGHTTYSTAFPVEARASGTFTMTVTLESPDGTIQLGPPTRVIIRSAVFSGIGIALTLGALLFLAGWWSNHFWRTRRARRRASTP